MVVFFHEVARYTKVHIIYCVYIYIYIYSDMYKITISGTPLVLDVTGIAAFTVLCCVVLGFCVHVMIYDSSDRLNVTLYVFPNQKWITVP